MIASADLFPTLVTRTPLGWSRSTSTKQKGSGEIGTAAKRVEKQRCAKTCTAKICIKV